MNKTAREVIKDTLLGVGAQLDGIDEDTNHVMADLDAAGFVIVPKEPTEKMINAGSAAKYESTERGNSNTASTYRAMIAAAPREAG